MAEIDPFAPDPDVPNDGADLYDQHPPDMGALDYPWSQGAPTLGDAAAGSPDDPHALGLAAAPQGQQTEFPHPTLPPPIDAPTAPLALPAPEHPALAPIPNSDPNAPDAVSGTDALPLPADQRAPEMPREYIGHDATQSDEQNAMEQARLLSPAEIETDRIHREELAATQARADAARVAAKDLQTQSDNYFNLQKAHIQAQAAREKIDADAKQIAQLNPNRVYQNMPTWAKLTGFLSSIVSGAAGGFLKTGRNTAMEELDKSIDADIEAQKFNIGNQRADIAQRRQGVTEGLGEQLDQFHQAELYRQSVYQRAMGDIATKMQDYDPHGKVVNDMAKMYQSFATASAQSADAHQQRTIKTGMDLLKAESEAAEKLATTEKIKAETDKLRGKIGGTGAPGVGTGANPNYAIATNLFDPFTRAPVNGRVKLDKGAETKLQSELDDYQDEQKAWTRLATIAERMDGHRNAMGQIAKRFLTTDETEYKAARAALLTHKLKALGERPNPASIEANEAMVPELQVAFGAADTRELISRAQSDNDSKLAGHLNIMGVDGDSVIASARKSRQLGAKPAITDEVADAQTALSRAAPGTAEARDAQAAYDAAVDRRAEHIDRKKSDKAAVATQTTKAKLDTLQAPLNVEGTPSKVAAEIESHNQAIEAQQRELDKLTKLQATSIKPTGKIGIDQQAHAEHQAAIEHQAGVARDAERATSLTLNSTLRATIKDFDSLSADKQAAINALAEQHGAPSGAVRKLWMMKMTTDENSSPAFRYGLIKILGGEGAGDGH